MFLSGNRPECEQQWIRLHVPFPYLCSTLSLNREALIPNPASLITTTPQRLSGVLNTGRDTGLEPINKTNTTPKSLAASPNNQTLKPKCYDPANSEPENLNPK